MTLSSPDLPQVSQIKTQELSPAKYVIDALETSKTRWAQWDSIARAFEKSPQNKAAQYTAEMSMTPPSKIKDLQGCFEYVGHKYQLDPNSNNSALTSLRFDPINNNDPFITLSNSSHHIRTLEDDTKVHVPDNRITLQETAVLFDGSTLQRELQYYYNNHLPDNESFEPMTEDIKIIFNIHGRELNGQYSLSSHRWLYTSNKDEPKFNNSPEYTLTDEHQRTICGMRTIGETESENDVSEVIYANTGVPNSSALDSGTKRSTTKEAIPIIMDIMAKLSGKKCTDKTREYVEKLRVTRPIYYDRMQYS